MNNSNFLKVIIVVVFSLFFFSCNEKPSFSLLSIELARQDSFDMDIVINLKEGYLLHKGHFMMRAGDRSLSPDIFELTKEQTDSLSVLYKAIKVTKEKRQVIDKKMLLSYIEAVEGDKIIAQRRQNSKRTQEEKIFLKKILNLIATKSKAPNAHKVMEILIQAL
jgi:hypothetical protein